MTFCFESSSDLLWEKKNVLVVDKICESEGTIQQVNQAVKTKNNFWKRNTFLTFPVGFEFPINFSHLNFNCCSVLDLTNLQEQVKNTFCFKNCTDLSLFEEKFQVISKNLQILSLQSWISKSILNLCNRLFLTVGQNNFGNKIIFCNLPLEVLLNQI